MSEQLEEKAIADGRFYIGPEFGYITFRKGEAIPPAILTKHRDRLEAVGVLRKTEASSPKKQEK